MRGRCVVFEVFEPRLLLEGSVLISELMAINDHTLQDGDQQYSDWLEIHNPTAEPVDLTGWQLKDSNDTWPLPDGTELGPGEFLVIFASNGRETVTDPADPYLDPGGYLHTNFKLSSNGERLGLFDDTGAVVHEYDEYPEQAEDISYGIAQDVETTMFVSSGDSARYLVPTEDPGNWTNIGFDDGEWLTGDTGLGFSDLVPGFAVRNIKANTTVGHLDTALQVIDNPGMQSYVHTAQADVINYYNSGGHGHYLNEPNFPGFSTDVDHFVVEATGFVTIPSAGPWSFGVNSDDGFGLWLDNGTDSFSMSFPGLRGAADTIATFDFPAAGVYSLRLVFYECTGGGSLEFFAAPGAHSAFSAAAFDLVGDTANGPLAVESIPIDGGAGGSGSGFSTLIETDVQDVMQGVNASMFVRIPFTVDDPAQIESLTLKMKYDDGYAAYINGHEVAVRNAPGTPLWNSNATGERGDAEATAWENVSLADHVDKLVVGDNVLAVHALNYTLDDGDFLVLPELLEVEYLGLGEHFFATATPGEANTEEYWLYVEDLEFSHERGFYDEALAVEIATDTEGAAIYYTTDGSAPSETGGQLYNPLTGVPIAATTVLSAAAFKANHAPTAVVAHTYIFLDDVIAQPAAPDGFPTSWISTAADYEMDPDITNNELYSDTLRDDLLSLPTMSIVMDLDDLFGGQGIYSNPTAQGVAWERPASLEYFWPEGLDGSEEFQINAGLRMYGGVGRNPGYKKHSFRFLFKDDYGPTKLQFPLFGEGAVDEFDTIILRSNFNDAWVWGGTNVQFIRDTFASDLQLAMGMPTKHSNFVHLYVNGLYWGLYNPTERPDQSFGAAYMGGEKEDWDGVNSGAPTGESSAAPYNTFRTFGDTRDLTTIADYQLFMGNNPDGTNNPDYETYLDAENYINYLLLNDYVGNRDWPSHNWYAGRMKGPDSTGFKWYSWDAEWIVGMNSGLTENRTGVTSYLCQPYGELRYNSEFQALFGDIAHQHFFNGGVLTPERTGAMYQAMADQVERAVIAESARWGDVRSSAPRTVEDWRNQRDWILGTYLPQRSGVVLNQLRSAGLYPGVTAPSFSVNGAYRHGGTFVLGDVLTIEVDPAAAIYYSLDGSDPRPVGGAAPDEAYAYAGPIALTEGVHVKSRVYENGQWSALNEATFYLDLAPDIRITEIMYNPVDPTQAEIDAGHTNNDDFEFLEVKNISATDTLGLEGLRLSNGVGLTFPQVWVPPGGYVVVVRNEAAFHFRYDTFTGTIAGEYTGSLNNGGERVELDAPVGGIIHDFRYGDGWYGHTDGDGFSLTIRDPLGADELWGLSEGWRGSTAPGGTPGTDDVLIDPGSIVITEVLAHSNAPLVDAIELHNTTDSPIDVTGWWMSDTKIDLVKYQIPATDPIGGGEYVTLYEDADFGTAFALSELGDDVYLSTNAGGVAGGYREHVDFGASPGDVAIGLHTKSTGGTDFTLLSAHGFGSANAYPYLEDLVINEVLYHPLGPTDDEIAAGFVNDEDFEWVEIHNTSETTTHTLSDFYLSSGVGFTFGWYDADSASAESWTLEPGATAAWDAVLPAGVAAYEVFARWDLLDGEGDARDLDGRASYTVTHADGTTEVIRDQKPEDDDEGPDYMDAEGWVSLGTYNFDSSGGVVLTRGTNDPGNWTIADQVKFVRPGHANVIVDDPTLASRYTANGPAEIAPGGYVVVVSNYDAFDYRYGIAANGIPVAGVYTGSLSNNGEKLKLMREGDAEPTGFIPYYRIDYVNYDDEVPWPLEPDGQGYSLNRLRGDPGELYGNDPASWEAGSYLGTPGRENQPLDPTPPTAPTDVSPVVVLAGGTRIELTWTPAADPDSHVDYYIIYRDGEPIGTSTATAFTDTNVLRVTPYSYEVSAVNRDQFAGDRSTAAAITIPGVATFEVSDATTLRLNFTEPLEPASAEDTAKYTFSGGAVSSAVLEGGQTVALAVDAMQFGQSYTVTVAAIDTVSGLLMPAGQELAFEYLAPSGRILREYWTGVSGTAVVDLTNSANYPDNPDRRNYPSTFEAPVNLTDNYGTRMRGHVHPAESGDYTFWIASDNDSRLYLSTDHDPANASLIASVSGATSWRNWTAQASQQSVEIHLSKGLRYYIEAVQKEATGGDHLSVAWQRTGGAFEGPIPGSYLSPYLIETLDTSSPAAPGGLSAQPVTSVRIDLAWDAASDAESGVDYYVIYRDGVEIATTGETTYIDTGLDQTRTYTYAVAAVNGDEFEGDASPVSAGPAPSVAAASALSDTEVRVTFGKDVTQATAEITANYTVTGGAGQGLTVLAADWNAGSDSQVTLTLAEPLVEGVIHTLAVESVEDADATPVEPAAGMQFVFGDLDADLLAWWTFDVDNEIVAHDLTANNRDLTVYGAEWTDQGRIGGAYQFDGSVGDYLLDGDGEGYINGRTALTFAAWIKADALGTDRGFVYFRGPDNNDEYGFRHDGVLQSQSDAPNGFRGGLRATGGTQRWESPPGVQTTDWQHITITWASGQDIQVYLDGVPVAAGWKTAAVTGSLQWSNQVIIGRGSHDSNRSWQGLIDDVRIYSDVLTQPEITALIDPRPYAQDDAYEVVQDTTLTVVGTGVLANDFDPDPGPAPLTADLVDDASHGAVELADDGTFTYTPVAGYSGPDSFTYRAYDGEACGEPGTVNIAVLDAVRILSAEVPDAEHVQLLFSTDLDATSAQTAANYVLSDAPAVLSASLGVDLRTVTLVISPALADNQEYTLTVSNVADGLGHVIAPGTQLAVEYTTWTGQDIGAVGAAGSSSEDAGVWTIEASGADIWYNSDEFHFLARPFAADVTVTARVVSMTNTNAWAKAGVMIRETLDADSAYAATFVTPANGISFHYRSQTNQQCYKADSAGSAPYWVRIVRHAETFTSYKSLDGVDWTLVGSNTVTMAEEPFYVGLAVTSHNDGAICTAEIDNVSVVELDTTPPTADVTDVTPDPISTAVDEIEIVFDEEVAGLDVTDFTLTLDGSANLLTATQTVQTADGVTWTLGNLADLTAATGAYVLMLHAAGSEIEDLAGNALAAGAAEDWLTVLVGPIPDITDVAPDPRNAPVDAMQIVFSEAVTDFDIGDLTLVRDGGADLLTTDQTLETTDGITWALTGLTAVTAAAGAYTLTLTAAGSDIENAAHEALPIDAADTWTADTTPPAAAIADVDPDPRSSAVAEIEIVFDEPVVDLGLDDIALTNGGGTNLLTGDETLDTADGLTWTLGNLLGLTGAVSSSGSPLGDGFVAYNDQSAGAGTHPNTTRYAANGVTSGRLKDASTGLDIDVTLTVTHTLAGYYTDGAAPAAGTHAHHLFNGYVDFSPTAGNSVQVAAGASHTHTFSGLDTGSVIAYSFHGTAIRGNASYTNRWTLVTLEGAAATPDHSTGIGVIAISPTQVALWTGHNSAANQGFVAGWTGIDPGADGQFAVVSTQYTGATPGVGSGTANGTKGYAIAGLRLSENVPTGADGEYTLTVAAAEVHDAAGNRLAADVSDTFVIDTTPPSADIIDVAPDPRTTAVDEIQIVFSEPVAGLDITDLSLTRDGGVDLLKGGESLTSADDTTWTLGDLAELTEPAGTYTLTLASADSNIGDRMAYPLTGDAGDEWVKLAAPQIAVTDSSGADDDAAIRFTTALSEFRTGAEDSFLVRPAYPDTKQYIDVTNASGSTLTIREIQIFAPDVTVKRPVTGDPADYVVLEVGETHHIELTYAPSLPTLADETTRSFDLPAGLMIVSDAGNDPAFEVALRGDSTFNSDISYDGGVNLNELGVLNVNFGLTSADPNFDPTADITGDGRVNLAELGPLNADFGRQRPAVTSAEAQTSQPAAVPATVVAPATAADVPASADPAPDASGEASLTPELVAAGLDLLRTAAPLTTDADKTSMISDVPEDPLDTTCDLPDPIPDVAEPVRMSTPADPITTADTDAAEGSLIDVGWPLAADTVLVDPTASRLDPLAGDPAGAS